MLTIKGRQLDKEERRLSVELYVSVHIIFDDAFETNSKSKQRVLNSWVRQFIEVMPEALG